MEVVKLLCVSLCAGCMAELNFGEFLSCLDQVIFMAERVSKYDFAALINKILSGSIAFVGLGNVGLNKNLLVGKLQSFLDLVNGVEEVKVVG